MITIPNKFFSKWEALKAQGDYAKIAELANVHPVTVMRAYENRRCDAELLEVIIKFYEERDELLREYMD